MARRRAEPDPTKELDQSMNFKTTILLIVALAIVGAAVFFARDRAPEPADRTTAIGTTDEQPLFDNLRAADVRRIRIERADARPVVAEKTDGTWRLIEPTPAAADQGLVESLSDQIANLQSRGQVRLDEHTRRQLGLHQPRLRVELTTADGKTTRLDLGERSGTGDGVYARKADGDQAHLVPAAIVESLDRPASAFRSKALVDVRPAEVREIRVTRPDETLALRQENGTWQILEPQPMPADDREAQDLITAVTNARAVEFITDDSAQASPYQLDDPAATIVISSVPAAQPDNPSRPLRRRAPPQRLRDVRGHGADREGAGASPGASPAARDRVAQQRSGVDRPRNGSANRHQHGVVQQRRATRGAGAHGRRRG
jgi:hypothetical protein